MYKSSELHYRDHLFPQSQLNNIQSKINPHPPNICNRYIGKHSNFHCCHYIVAVQGQRQNYESLNGNFKTHSFNPGFSNFYIHKMSIGIPWESSCNGQWACGSHLTHLSFCLLGFHILVTKPSHRPHNSAWKGVLFTLYDILLKQMMNCGWGRGVHWGKRHGVIFG